MLLIGVGLRSKFSVSFVDPVRLDSGDLFFLYESKLFVDLLSSGIVAKNLCMNEELEMLATN
jgi:hypothetical protein